MTGKQGIKIRSALSNGTKFPRASTCCTSRIGRKMRNKYSVLNLPLKFRQRIVMIGDCWAWCGVVNGHSGYGQVNWRGYTAHKVHRATYELLVGPIPDGLTIDHLCFNRMCCNPAHLEPVTNRENILRGNNLCAKNARKSACPKGHNYEQYGFTNKRGSRSCRICTRQQGNEWSRRNRQASRSASKGPNGIQTHS